MKIIKNEETGTYCAVCRSQGMWEPQVLSPAGVTCKFGHGGADGIAKPEENLPPEAQVPEPVPELTAEDVMAFVQVITALVMMGATRIEIHPERWPLVFRGLILHRAYDISQLTYIEGRQDFDHAVMHVEFGTENGKVGCLLMQRRTRIDETEEQTFRLDTQGASYDQPKLIETPDTKIWSPS